MASSSFSDRLVISFVVCLWILAAGCEINAATLPAGFTETQVATGLSNPTAMEFAPDGRLFVCQQGGQLRVIKNGVLLSTPFVSLLVDSSGERGLLGIAFDPNFATNNFVYVYYTPVASSPRHNRVSRFTASGDVAVANSEVVIMTLDNLSTATNHNGGAIHFGPDGKLYVAVGENANGSNSQTLTNRLGKMLRINSDGSIPTDNPFYNTALGLNRAIWSLGLRNPYTFAFQQNTGRMFINDVGQSTWEEINDGIAGSNYGWPTTEGPTTNPNFRTPLFFYGRSPSDTGGCAITGGSFYNPATIQFPAGYVGKYFFADFCSGWIRLLDPASATATGFATGIASPVDLRVTADGSLYYLARGAGAVFRIQYPANATPPPVLETEAGNDRAIAFDSVTMMRDPFPLNTPFNFSSDHQTRIILLARNADLLPGETSSAITAQAEDSLLMVYPLTVEFSGKVPGFDSWTQVVVRLPDSVSGNGDLLATITIHGKISNKARIRIQ